MIRNIIFDLGNVIVPIDPQLTLHAFLRQGARNIEKFYSTEHQHEAIRSFDRGMISPEEFRAQVSETLALKLPESEFDACWSAVIKTVPAENLALLRNLRSKYRTFVLSNTNAIHADALHRQLAATHGLSSLATLVERVFYSFELGLSKPSREIYEHVVHSGQIIPEETLFLDDILKNIESARNVGMHAVQVRDPFQLPDLIQELLAKQPKS